jgi:hypothetical protein
LLISHWKKVNQNSCGNVCGLICHVPVYVSRSEVTAATARRNEIVNALLEVLTSDAFTTKELQHYRFVGEIFQVSSVVRKLCSSASSLEGRTELSLSVALAALAIAIDDTPPGPSERVLKRREAREADKAFKRSLAAGKSAKRAASSKEDKPLKPLKGLSRTAKYYHAKRAKMTEIELVADRAKRAAVMREIRAKKKAAAAPILPGIAGKSASRLV